MNLEEYLNQETPRLQRVGSVVLKEDEVKLTRVGIHGYVVHIPKVLERFSKNGTTGNYYLKSPPYPGGKETQLWVMDKDGNPSVRSVFSIGFNPFV